MKINCKTRGGGSVTFNAKQHVWASYRVTRVGTCPVPELFYAGVGLPDGRHVSLFVNRKTNLVVLDVIDKGGRSGCEVYRCKV
jgi:hypothetical protein